MILGHQALRADRRADRFLAERVEPAVVVAAAAVVDHLRRGLLDIHRERWRAGRRADPLGDALDDRDLVVGARGRRLGGHVGQHRGRFGGEVVAEHPAERALDVGIDAGIHALARVTVRVRIVSEVAAAIDADLLLEDHVAVGERDVIDLDGDVEVILDGRAERDQPTDLRDQIFDGVLALVEVLVGVGLEAPVLREAVGGHRRRDEHDRDLRERTLAALLEHLEAALLRLLDPDDQHRRQVRGRQRDRLIRIGLDHDIDPVPRELPGQGLVERGISVDQQDASVHAPKG